MALCSETRRQHALAAPDRVRKRRRHPTLDETRPGNRGLLPCATALIAAAAIPALATAQTAPAITPTPTHQHKSTTHHHVPAKPMARTTHVMPSAAPATMAAPIPARSFTNLAAASPRLVDAAAPEAVVVTGSMLSTSANQGADPVQIITATQIQQTGATSMGDYLQRLPSMGSGGTYNSQTNGTAGAACADLRNLGQNRVLVLIDGKRTSLNGENSCVDLNTIPIQAVQSVEILKDGGSELYGADAVSGVINIKLKHNMNDANITVRGGITDQGDDRTGMISGYKGFNFDHDKGNITIFAQYETVGGVPQRDRSWATPVAVTNNPTGQQAYGSSIPPGGNIFTADGNYEWSTSNNGTSIHNFTDADRYNYGSQQWISNAYQDATANGDFHYDINRHFSVYATALYSHRATAVTLAGEPTSGSVPPSNLPNAFILPANAPYNPTGPNGLATLSGLYSGAPQDVYLYRRLIELGDRRFESQTDTVTGKFGVQGEITHHWMYDVSYTYGANQYADQGENIGSYQNLMNSYGIQQLDPSDPNSAVTYNPAVCQASAGCQLVTNAFSRLTPQQINYINYTTHDGGSYQMRDLNVRIHNDKVATMPWAGGGAFGIALGMEHRSEQLNYNPDPLAAAGLSMTNTSQYTGGGFNVNEAYLEGRAQLLHDVAFAHDLTIDGQGRFSSYNTFGSTENWKVSINWAPIRDIRFRATLGTSFRQPNVYELYGGQGLSYLAGNDPCAGGSYAISATVIANCMKHGVVNPQTLVDANSGQIPSLVGGNASLKPETGRTYTVGTVITPRWTPGLSASVEYWHYTLKNMIAALSPQYVANQCYQYNNPKYCNQIDRSALTDQINDLSTIDTNVGGLRTSGIDFDLDYRIRVTPEDVFVLHNNYQQLISYLEQFEPGGAWDNLAGRLMYTTGNGQPRVRDYATATWMHGAFSFTYMMQYMGGMQWNDGQTDLATYNAQSIAAGNGPLYGYTHTPGIFTHDVSVGYNFRRWKFTAGVNNILNKNPPFVQDSTENSASGLYSNLFIGRYIWAQAGVNF
ncbi:TonB-dependent receptor domain-containing protein [Nguyenibacter vanlangensis]|uniref:TonB-dependent receptor n=1 Tax=Nguyenibacter vanlangensis TaxID=1216886 RepID=A0A7Y7IUR3_9PROT|nr:TonB-dependent receptor [Nguyenibacter vanlangensis]NVN10512.1 TonB-dependent receptor [Nguyenibacter vanlangensis]